MKTELVKLEVQELNVLEPSKAEQIRKVFEPMVDMLKDLEQEYETLISEASDEITADVTKRAKRLRLDIGKVRIETGKLKDKQKEYIKLEDRAIMGVHNILVWAVKEKEDKLKDIENHFEILERKRLDDLQKVRAERLSQYIEDAYDRDLAKFQDEEFEALLSMKKKEYEDRIEAEKKAELERIAKEKADREERERIEKENAKLKAEAIEREKRERADAEARAKIEAERKAKEEAEAKARAEKERKERDEYEAKLRAEREAREKVEREERLKREKLEAELRAKEEAEARAKAEAEAKLQAELNKGDNDKVLDLIADFTTLKTKYQFKSAKNKKMYADVSVLIDKVINHIKA